MNRFLLIFCILVSIHITTNIPIPLDLETDSRYDTLKQLNQILEQLMDEEKGKMVKKYEGKLPMLSEQSTSEHENQKNQLDNLQLDNETASSWLKSTRDPAISRKKRLHVQEMIWEGLRERLVI
ncbi:hypothetical protein SNEBB_008573 [Seison nebaliae]|nr:hypothetical protein SNEBB_008573 [Seison nebaliae]